MDFEETARRDMVGYDERTETWFLRARETQRLMLTRQSLLRLVQMYNGIHQGRPLLLLERRELERLEAECREQSDRIAELRSRLSTPGPVGSPRRWVRMAANLLRGRR